MTFRLVTIDASVVVRWVLDDEPSRAGAVALRRELEAGRVAAVQPAHFLLEVAAALDRARRDGRIGLEDARAALSAVEAISFDDAPPIPAAGGAFDVAADTGLRVPDAAYVACAASNGATLVSADVRQVAAAERTGVAVLALTDVQSP